MTETLETVEHAPNRRRTRGRHGRIHRGNLDIRAMVPHNGGTQQFPDAVPLTCNPECHDGQSADLALLVRPHIVRLPDLSHLPLPPACLGTHMAYPREQSPNRIGESRCHRRKPNR